MVWKQNESTNIHVVLLISKVQTSKFKTLLVFLNQLFEIWNECFSIPKTANLKKFIFKVELGLEKKLILTINTSYYFFS